ncbi:MAG: DUF2400 family protein, partial [Thermoanaerobaculia bacterium]
MLNGSARRLVFSIEMPATRTRTQPLRREALQERLNTLVDTFDVTTIEPDPLQLVHRYHDPLDQEVAGLIAAAFAYGRADVIVRNIGALLDQMQPSPFRYLSTFDPREGRVRFKPFAYRFHKRDDLVALLERIANVLRDHHSLGELFRLCYDEGDDDIGPSLTRFVAAILAAGKQSPTGNLKYLLTSPSDGSACKRMNLYLRWMIRCTSPDLGLWTFVDPAKLLVPLDT